MIWRVTTAPMRQKFSESPPRLISHPPPPNADHWPQSFSIHSGNRKDACCSPTAGDALGKNTLGNMATSSPKFCCVRNRYLAASSTLPKFNADGPHDGTL